MKIVYFLLVILLSMCTAGCNTDKNSLSTEEVNALRSKYPIEELCGNPFYDVVEITLAEGVNKAEDWVRVKCVNQFKDIIITGATGAEVSDPLIAAVEIKQNVLMSVTLSFHIYEMEVVDSVFGNFEKGDTFLLAIGDSYWDVLPDFADRNEYLMGIIQNSNPMMTGYYSTIGDTTFYLTPEEYVLSLTATQPQNRLSGITYENIKKELINLRN